MTELLEPVVAPRSSAPDRRRPTRVDLDRTAPIWIAVVLAVGLGGVAPAVVVMSQPNVTGRLVWIPAVAVMAWCAVRLAGIVASDRPPLFQFAFHTYVYAYFGLAPLVQLRAGEFPLTSPLVEAENVVTIWWLLGTGIGAYEVGVWLMRRHRAVARDLEPLDPVADGEGTSATGPTLRISEGRTTILVFVGIALSLLFIAVVGPGALFASREDVSNALDGMFADSSLSAIALAVGFGPLLVAVHALLRVRRRNIAEGIHRHKTPLILVAVLVLLVAVNPISASRYNAGTLVLSFVVLFGGLATAWRRRVVLLGVFGSFVFLLPSLALSRYSADNLYTGPTADSFLGNIAFSGDWDSFAAVGNAVHYVQGHGSTYGFQFLGSVCFWVPRSLWPNKPIDTGILLAQDRGYPMTNLSAPLWAEAYINGGFFVVAAVFLAYGAVSVLASTRTWRALRSNGPWAIAGCIFAWYSFILLRGSLLQATGGAVLMLVCILFVVERRRPVPVLSIPREKAPPS